MSPENAFILRSGDLGTPLFNRGSSFLLVVDRSAEHHSIGIFALPMTNLLEAQMWMSGSKISTVVYPSAAFSRSTKLSSKYCWPSAAPSAAVKS